MPKIPEGAGLLLTGGAIALLILLQFVTTMFADLVFSLMIAGAGYLLGRLTKQ